MIRKMLALFLIITISLTNSWTATRAFAQQSPESQLSYKEAVKRLDRFIELIEELRSYIDRSQFDLDALLDKLDYDADKIIKFVKEEIYFEQYPGLLRGARGTLLARAGNSLDQAVLLATLLKNAGYDAQIMGGKLEESDAKLLIKQMSIPRKSQPTLGDIGELRKVFTKLGNFLELDEREMDDKFNIFFESQEPELADEFRNSSVYQSFLKDRRFLETALTNNKIKLGVPEFLSNMIDEARDYYLVRYRPEPSSKWQKIHAAFYPKSGTPGSIVGSTIFKESIPKEKQHRVRIEAFVERKLGSQIEVFPVMAPWERPVANIIDRSITYRNHPDGYRNISEWSEMAVAEAIESSETFYPFFNGALAKGVKAFDLLGNVVSPEEMSSPQAGIFRTVSARVGKATGMLSATGKSKDKALAEGPVQALLKHWIKISIIDPSGAEQSHTRVLAQVTSNKADYNFEFKKLLVQEVSFAISVGGYPKAYSLDLNLKQLHAIKPVVYSGLFHASTAKLEPFSEHEFISDADLRWADHVSLAQLLDIGHLFTANTVSYRSKPLVVAKYLPADLSNVGSFTIDIIDNARRTFKTVDGFIRPDYLANISHGVWDTYAESLSVPLETQRKFNAISVFKAAAEQGISSIIITKKDIQFLENLGLNAHTIANLNRDLENNYVLITPANKVSTVSGFGWWRINPRTGQTLGMTDNGGSITVEELTLHATNTLGKYYATKGYRAALYCTALTASLGLAIGNIDPSVGVATALFGWAGNAVLKKLGISWTPGMAMSAFLKDCVVAVALRI